MSRPTIAQLQTVPEEVGEGWVEISQYEGITLPDLGNKYYKWKLRQSADKKSFSIEIVQGRGNVGNQIVAATVVITNMVVTGRAFGQQPETSTKEKSVQISSINTLLQTYHMQFKNQHIKTHLNIFKSFKTYINQINFPIFEEYENFVDAYAFFWLIEDVESEVFKNGKTETIYRIDINLYTCKRSERNTSEYDPWPSYNPCTIHGAPFNILTVQGFSDESGNLPAPKTIRVNGENDLLTTINSVLKTYESDQFVDKYLNPDNPRHNMADMFTIDQMCDHLITNYGLKKSGQKQK